VSFSGAVTHLPPGDVRTGNSYNMNCVLPCQTGSVPIMIVFPETAGPHVDAVDAGEAEIQDHHVRVLARRDLQRLLAVESGLNVIPARAKIRA